MPHQKSSLNDSAVTQTPSSFTVAELARHTGGELVGASDTVIDGLETVHDARAGHLTFIGDAKHALAWGASRASAAIISRKLVKTMSPGEGRTLIIVPDADVAMIAVLELFVRPDVALPASVHPSASIDPTAQIAGGVHVGPFVSIGARSTIGADTVIRAGTQIYHDVIVGEHCYLHANVTIRERSVIGRGVILHGGVQIGTDGFGYRPAPDGRGLLKVPHLGNVVLGDDVEIGANTCVDRGKFGATSIGAGTKLDNLVQIGHNCRIGRACVISGLAGIAGSTVVGDGALIGGGAGIADHLTLGKGVRIAARSGVMNDVPDGETWAGYPAKDARRAMQEAIVARNLPEYLKNLKHLLGPDAARVLERGPDSAMTASKGLA